MDIQLLKTFLTVAAHKSVTKASEEVHLTQPAVTKQIKALEQEYGAVLFERKNKEFSLTQEGEVLLGYAWRIVNLHKESLDLIMERQGKPSGTLTMGANLTLGICILPKLIMLFNKDYPELRIKLHLDNTLHMIEAIKRSFVNFGLVAMEIKDPLITQHLFYRDPIKVVFGPSLEPHRTTFSWKELEALPFISRELGSDIRDLCSRWMKEKGIKLSGMIEVNSTEAIKACVQLGMGFSLLPQCTIHEEVKSGSLRVISAPYFDLVQDYYICHYKEKRFSVAEKTFLEFLFGHMEAGPILHSSLQDQA